MTLTIIDYLIIAIIGYLLITYALPPALVKANIKHDEIALKLQFDELYEKIVDLTTDNSIFKDLPKDEQKIGKSQLKDFSNKCFEIYSNEDDDIKNRYHKLLDYKNQIDQFRSSIQKEIA